jgi:hypothetical protein
VYEFLVSKMKKVIPCLASIVLGTLALSAAADELRSSVSNGQPAPVNIAPTVRVTGGVPPAAPVSSAPVVRVTNGVEANATTNPEVAAQNLSKSKLTFMDSKLFDVKLFKELEAGKDVVEVEVSGRVPLSNIPQRIDKWVVRSAEEGKVELLPSEPVVKTRFLFALIPMAFSAYGSFKTMQEEHMIDQAKRYDTKIYYKKEDSGETLIEKIVMTRRRAN